MNNNIIKKKHIIVTLCFVLLIMLTLINLVSCTKTKYDKDWILGKTSSEIEEKYGSFHSAPTSSDSKKDGNYFNCSCFYLIREERVGFFGTDPAMYYRIYFDSDGKAYDVREKWFVPGG